MKPDPCVSQRTFFFFLFRNSIGYSYLSLLRDDCISRTGLYTIPMYTPEAASHGGRYTRISNTKGVTVDVNRESILP